MNTPFMEFRGLRCAQRALYAINNGAVFASKGAIAAVCVAAERVLASSAECRRLFVLDVIIQTWFGDRATYERERFCAWALYHAVRLLFPSSWSTLVKPMTPIVMIFKDSHILGHLVGWFARRDLMHARNIDVLMFLAYTFHSMLRMQDLSKTPSELVSVLRALLDALHGFISAHTYIVPELINDAAWVELMAPWPVVQRKLFA